MEETISLMLECQIEELDKDLDWKNIFYRKVEI